MPIDTSKVNQKISVPTGQVIFEEGASANSLNIIHEGAFLLEKKINGVIVVDEQRRPVGALNMHDLLKAGVV